MALSSSDCSRAALLPVELVKSKNYIWAAEKSKILIFAHQNQSWTPDRKNSQVVVCCGLFAPLVLQLGLGSLPYLNNHQMWLIALGPLLTMVAEELIGAVNRTDSNR